MKTFCFIALVFLLQGCHDREIRAHSVLFVTYKEPKGDEFHYTLSYPDGSQVKVTSSTNFDVGEEVMLRQENIVRVTTLATR